MTVADLIENGYKKYSFSIWNDSAKSMYQKDFKDRKGIKYFVTFYEYEESFEVELYTEKNDYTMKIDLYSINEKMTVIEIEKEVEEMWTKLGCKYYEEY